MQTISTKRLVFREPTLSGSNSLTGSSQWLINLSCAGAGNWVALFTDSPKNCYNIYLPVIFKMIIKAYSIEFNFHLFLTNFQSKQAEQKNPHLK